MDIGRHFTDFIYYFTNGFKLYFYPDVTPDPNKDVLFDQSYGFKEPRKAKGSVPTVMIATKEEMMSSKILLEDRDYCAHLLIDYKGCTADNWPFNYRCLHEQHAYLNCEYDEWMDRAKEYERERRLMLRKKRKEEQQDKELLS